LDVTVHNASALEPGYYLYAPHYESTAENEASGGNKTLFQEVPYIFDTAGELAWSGANVKDWGFVNDFKYHPWGEFSLLEGGTLKSSRPHGARPVIINASFQLAVPMTMPPSIEQVNPHDLQLANDGKAIVVEKAIAGAQQGLFQTIEDHIFEIDRHSGEIIFSWNSTEHITTPEPRFVDLEGFAQFTEVHFL
jgi:hypothetical protein